MASTFHSKSWCAAALVLTACTSEPQLVASNCDRGEDCLQRRDAVDVLLVVDNSGSVQHEASLLKAEVPRMLSAITTGAAGDLSFPPAKSVHVAVTTTDLGGSIVESGLCMGIGQDGLFLRPEDVGATCDAPYPGYLAYNVDAGQTAEDSARCLPLALVDPEAGRFAGCGLEQPLEAALKALWPKENTAVSFYSGHGHGSSEHAGFLRDNAILAVIIVSDEDDCSVADPDIFASSQPNNAYAHQPVELRCYLNPDKLHAPQRYIDHLKALRPHNDNVIFAVVGGIPPELVADDFRSHYDFTAPEQADRYFADVLAASDMQEVPVEPEAVNGRLRPSCTAMFGGATETATPPRRLVEVARSFGAQGVLGSICAEDFGTTTGHIIRALAQKLSAPSAR